MSFGHHGQNMLQRPENTASLLGVTFYLNNRPVNATNMMIWLSYNGPKKDYRKYKFTIDVLDERKEEIVLSGTRFCVPCDTSWDDMKEEILGVTINKKLAQEVNVEGNPANNPEFNVNVQFFPAR